MIDTVRVKVTVIKESNSALLVSPDGKSSGAVWVPLSKVTVDPIEGRAVYLTLSREVARERKLKIRE